jgi:hypothetical protein
MARTTIAGNLIRNCDRTMPAEPNLVGPIAGCSFLPVPSSHNDQSVDQQQDGTHQEDSARESNMGS